MAKKQKLSPGREMALNILFENYDIKSADDLQEALKDLLGGGIKKMLEAEMDEHLGYKRDKLVTLVILGMDIKVRKLEVIKEKLNFLYHRIARVHLSL